MREELIKLAESIDQVYVVNPKTKRLFHNIVDYGDIKILFKFFIQNNSEKTSIIKPKQLFISKIITMPNELEVFIGHRNVEEIDVKSHNKEVLKETFNNSKNVMLLSAPINDQLTNIYFIKNEGTQIRSIDYFIRKAVNICTM